MFPNVNSVALHIEEDHDRKTSKRQNAIIFINIFDIPFNFS